MSDETRILLMNVLNSNNSRCFTAYNYFINDKRLGSIVINDKSATKRSSVELFLRLLEFGTEQKVLILLHR